ncbi:MAG: ABC transporter permease [Caldilineaceae bacterium]|nr:ABC transporter permease [Caldilineaceae bacterium]
MRDTWTIVWKELKELVVARAGRPLCSAGHLAMLALFGIAAPWWWGRQWLSDSLVFWVWVLLPLPLVIGAAAESFAGERERHTLETLLASPLSDRAILTGKIMAAALFGWLNSVAIQVLGLITVNLVYAADGFIVYAPALGVGSLTLGLLAAALTACIGVLVSLRVTTVRQARLTLTLFIVALGFMVAAAGAVGLHFLPSGSLDRLAAGLSAPSVTASLAVLAFGLLLADAALYFAVTCCFRRTQLLAE